MLQQVVTAPGKIVFHQVPVPDPAPGQVLIRVMKIGICGSDIHVMHGKHPFTKYPVTQGHEMSGVIAKVGEGVSAFLAGQKVTVEPQLVCGACYPCRHGQYNLCEKLKVMGFQSTGVASEYYLTDAAKVTPLPDELSFDQGAMIEPLAVAVHAVRRAGNIQGKNVAVLGAGPIGNLVAQTAKGMGAARVLITDIVDYRLEIAEKCGIDYCVNTSCEDCGQAILEQFGTDRADVIFDCAGNNITMGQAIAQARKGSAIILVAVFAGPATIDLAVVNDHELTIASSMMYVHEDYLEAIRLVREGCVQLDTLVSAQFPFREYQKAYDFIDRNPEKAMKVLIDVQA